jgi:hypothetical protein
MHLKKRSEKRQTLDTKCCEKIHLKKDRHTVLDTKFCEKIHLKKLKVKKCTAYAIFQPTLGEGSH